MFTALAENFGNMKDKISAFVALAPVVNLTEKHIFGSKKELVMTINALKITKDNNMYEFGTTNPLYNWCL